MYPSRLGRLVAILATVAGFSAFAGSAYAQIFTGGADLDAVRRLSPDGDGYSATAAMSFIRRS